MPRGTVLEARKLHKRGGEERPFWAIGETENVERERERESRGRERDREGTESKGKLLLAACHG